MNMASFGPFLRITLAATGAKSIFITVAGNMIKPESIIDLPNPAGAGS